MTSITMTYLFSALSKRLTIGLLSVGAATLMVACGSSPNMATDPTMTDDDSTAAETPSGEYAAMEANTIVDVAAGSEDFSLLVQAIEAAELAPVLASSDDITVFAPTNEAFEALPEGALDQLLLPENREALRQVLTYHVLPQQVVAADVATGEVLTLADAPLALMVDEATGTVMINNAQVITPDIMASNGVIHAIDQVLLPPELVQ
ncbi:MAG: fasciclin domain-containing protein [Spirulina sp.]